MTKDAKHMINCVWETKGRYGLNIVLDTLLNVSGVGEAKYRKYGKRFIDAVTAFIEEYPGAVTSMKDEDHATDEKVIFQEKSKKHKELEQMKIRL